MKAKWFLMMAGLIIIWSLSWPIYKVALVYTPPLLFAGMRCLLGGALLAGFIWKTRDRIQWKKNWKIYVITGLLNITLFYGLQTEGLKLVPSGLFSVIVYFQPILVGLFAWLWLGETMTLTKVLGLILGFLGVISVSAEGFSGHVSILGILFGLLSALSWAFGTIYTKKMAHSVDSLWMVALQCLIGGVVLMISGLSTEKWSSIVWNGTYFSGLAFGAILGIAISWIFYVTLVKTGDASVVATFTFLVPMLAVVIGTIFLSEPFTKLLFVGIILIVASILLVNKKKKQTQELFQGV
ncbi:DMT family transporter [Pullulanibacillus sp. KACC 23026]|uniref:DMT family transporter n=1 Tax=Pullulanibacillus sp. KACC 23026 TaxID=3028315 RepID=UPI0023AEF4A9|nr:DMT family transporter [Pullulanibacillus sp. KACC 23026]WEG13520.1 DMT family transporter [Pullulanibacillus sp. KACC 23026]